MLTFPVKAQLPSMGEPPSISTSTISSSLPDPGTVLDIGGSYLSISLSSMISQHLFSPIHRLLPSAFMWDDTGLSLWREINRLPNYNQTKDEMALFERWGDNIAGLVEDGTVIVDLGSGDIRKIKIFLDKLEGMGKNITYYALDLSLASLKQNMAQLVPSSPSSSALKFKGYEHIHCLALWGTFDDCLLWARSHHKLDTTKRSTFPPRWFCSLGSQFGNDYFADAVSLFLKWRDMLQPNDRMLIGMDGLVDQEKLWKSYHDEEGLFEKYIRNGFIHSNRVLGKEWWRNEEWNVSGEILDGPTMHRFIVSAKRDVDLEGRENKLEENGESRNKGFRRGEKIYCYEAFKYPPKMMYKQFEKAGLEVLQEWKSPGADLWQYLIRTRSIGGTKTDS